MKEWYYILVDLTTNFANRFRENLAFLELLNFHFQQSHSSSRLEKTNWKLLELKFIYSEKATKFCEISTLLSSVCTVDKSKVKISQNFVAFSEYTNSIETDQAAPNKMALPINNLP